MDNNDRMFGYDPYAGMSEFQKRYMKSRMNTSFVFGMFVGAGLTMIFALLISGALWP